ncbi:hypothetical protein PR003_g17201 [Phytophthora rubi]|uniref:Uncharacterized protein n=1 Tax=Phytophthora rubi TaxID=129364 RepID=A0A6A3K830_9STRA|nr:hypothetical protein PR002_g17270 [Phytophthora rubi]KAE9017457.1 hypothetical protein PR001_g14388 [Phytophthora rubi]KAE9322556.1 hypothetical protein PR003_g17201 [Phytophthora rubi]
MTGNAASPSSSALVSSVLICLHSKWGGQEHVGLPGDLISCVHRFSGSFNTKIDSLLNAHPVRVCIAAFTSTSHTQRRPTLVRRRASASCRLATACLISGGSLSISVVPIFIATNTLQKLSIPITMFNCTST